MENQPSDKVLHNFDLSQGTQKQKYEKTPSFQTQFISKSPKKKGSKQKSPPKIPTLLQPTDESDFAPVEIGGVTDDLQKLDNFLSSGDDPKIVNHHGQLSAEEPIEDLGQTKLNPLTDEDEEGQEQQQLENEEEYLAQLQVIASEQQQQQMLLQEQMEIYDENDQQEASLGGGDQQQYLPQYIQPNQPAQFGAYQEPADQFVQLQQQLEEYQYAQPQFQPPPRVETVMDPRMMVVPDQQMQQQFQASPEPYVVVTPPQQPPPPAAKTKFEFIKKDSSKSRQRPQTSKPAPPSRSRSQKSSASRQQERKASKSMRTLARATSKDIVKKQSQPRGQQPQKRVEKNLYNSTLTVPIRNQRNMDNLNSTQGLSQYNQLIQSQKLHLTQTMPVSYQPNIQYTTEQQLNESLGLPQNSYSVSQVGPDMRKKPEINKVSDILAKRSQTRSTRPGERIYDRLYRQNTEATKIAKMVKDQQGLMEKSREKVRQKHLRQFLSSRGSPKNASQRVLMSQPEFNMDNSLVGIPVLHMGGAQADLEDLVDVVMAQLN